MKPPVPYFGGKQRIAESIVSLFPDHSHYIEPYAGSLSVLLAKPESRIETVNDIDGDMVTFWRVLRDRPAEFQRACELTPHSRAERALSQGDKDGLVDLEVARRVWVQLTQGRSGIGRATGWRFYVNADATASPMATYLEAYRHRMPPAVRRLRSVQLECRDALDVIADYGTVESSLLYVDPPYTTDTRRGGQYKHEVDRDHHEALLDALTACRARVVLSGYDNPLYRDRLDGWTVERIAASTQQANNPGGGARVETLWLNYAPEQHLFSSGEAS